MKRYHPKREDAIRLVRMALDGLRLDAIAKLETLNSSTTSRFFVRDIGISYRKLANMGGVKTAEPIVDESPKYRKPPELALTAPPVAAGLVLPSLLMGISRVALTRPDLLPQLDGLVADFLAKVAA